MSFRNFTTGQGYSFGGEYLELIPNERPCYTDVFDDPNLPGAMRVTVTPRAVSVGCEVTIMQEVIPDAIPMAAEKLTLVLPGITIAPIQIPRRRA